MSEMTDRFPGNISSFGVLYPTNYIVAVMENDGRAKRAQDALVANGFAEDDVIDFAPEEFVSLVEAHRENKELWARFMESLSRTMGTEAVYVDLDLELARDGAGVVAVLVQGDEGKAKAREILDRFRPMAMRHYASLSIEVFVEHPQTASSAQNDGAAA
jgi:hypothetical protein